MKIGKLIGRAVGEVVALPATVVHSTGDAVDEAIDTIEKRIEGSDGDEARKKGERR